MKTSIGIKHLNTIENSVSKSMGILFKAKEIINTKGLRSLYYSFIPIFLNYGSLSWGNTHKASLKIIASRQKHAIRTIESNTLKRTTEKIYKLEILNIYKINLYISSYSYLELRKTPYHMCFMKDLQTLTISTQIGLVKTSLL